MEGFFPFQAFRLWRRRLFRHTGTAISLILSLKMAPKSLFKPAFGECAHLAAVIDCERGENLPGGGIQVFKILADGDVLGGEAGRQGGG